MLLELLADSTAILSPANLSKRENTAVLPNLNLQQVTPTNNTKAG